MVHRLAFVQHESKECFLHFLIIKKTKRRKILSDMKIM